MINKVTITNFQSHKSTTLSFVDFVNVIVGKTDSGKSAFIRAIKWCLFNTPGGDDFISWWGGECSVIIETDTHIIERRRTKAKNLYILDGKEFAAFGTKVPTEIAEALNVTALNLQNQIDGHFLLTDSPGTVAKHFGKIAKLERIAESLGILSGEMRALKTEVTRDSKEVLFKSAELHKVQGWKKTEPLLNKVKKISKVITQEEKQCKLLSSILDKIKSIDSDLKTYANVNECTQQFKTLRADSLQLVEDSKKGEILKDLIKAVTKMGEPHELSENVNAMKKILKDQNPILSKYIETKENQTKLQRILKQMADNSTSMQVKQIERYSLELQKKMPQVCPLCESKIGKA